MENPTAVATIYTHFQGHPLRLIQLLSTAQTKNIPLTAIRPNPPHLNAPVSHNCQIMRKTVVSSPTTPIHCKLVNS